MVYTMVYTHFFSIYHGIYNFQCFFLDCCILSCNHFQVVMLHRLASSCFPQFLTVVGHKTICQTGALETGKTTVMYSRPVVQAEDRVQAAGLRVPLAYLCDYLPGLRTGGINALLLDLPIPIACDVPEMTLDEAIEVLFRVYHGYIRCYIP
jgi:hypothetical protein